MSGLRASTKSQRELVQLVHDLRGSLCTMVAALRVIDRQTSDQPEVQEMVEIAMKGFNSSNEFIDRLQIFAELLLEQNTRLNPPVFATED